MMYTCAPAGPAPSSGGSRTVERNGTFRTIDIHCHCKSRKADEIVESRVDPGQRPSGPRLNPLTQEVARQQIADIEPKMSSVDVRLADMDKMGVDIQAISPAPSQYYYWTAPDVGREAARAINDSLADIVGRHPDRFVALGAVPLQDTDMAVAELDRCVDSLGFRGVEISTRVNDEELSERRLDRFFARAEERDIVIFIHPSGYTHPQRMADHYLTNLIGNPLETTIAAAHLIFDGVLDRHPGLKICLAHGGGYAGAYPARFDHGYHARRDCRAHIPHPPSHYLKSLYFDTMVFAPDQLAFLIDKYGSDHILLGTDYPYDMGYYDPHGLIGAVPDLSDDDRRRIAGLNAARLLNIATDQAD